MLRWFVSAKLRRLHRDEAFEVERIVQVGTPLSSSAATPVAWQSVGTLVGGVLANVKVEQDSEIRLFAEVDKAPVTRREQSGALAP